MRSPPVPLRSGRILGLMALLIGAATLGRAQTDGSAKSPWPFATMSSFTHGNILSSPALALDGTIYVGVEVGATTDATQAGKLFALNPNCTQKWVFPTPDWIDSTPAVGADGAIYFGCWDGNLYAVNADGTPKWKTPLGAFVSGSPALGADGTIYIGTGAGNLCAINPADGAVKWTFPTLYWIDSAPAVGTDGTIYVGSEDNSLYAIRPDGTEKWHYTTGNDIVGSPALSADGTVYVGSRDLKLYAFNADGTVKWTFQTTDMIDASPVIGNDGTVYAVTTGGRLLALRSDGTMKWQYPAANVAALGGLYSTPAVRSDGSIIFGSSDNAVFAVKADGTLLWKATVGDWADSSPVIAPDGTIYIGCTDKNVYAFNGTVGMLMTDWPQLLRNSARTGLQVFSAAPRTTGRLSNLSVRTQAGAGDNTLIVGFTVGGSGTRNLLVRGVGPTLATFSVSGVLSDPVITLYPGGATTPTATNDNWGDTNGAAIASASAAVGAFPLPNGSLDSALLSSFSAGGETLQVTGKNGATGIALLELYDNGGSSTARLTNVSARSFVNTGSGVLITGFVITGGTRAVLIRGIGPTLATFGVGGTLATPSMRLFNSNSTGQQMVVADNSGWSTTINATTISSTSRTVGAFALANGSLDAVMLVTLPAGNYTAQLSGANSTTGVGLIEVYEVP